jgi:hypothetical protein
VAASRKIKSHFVDEKVGALVTLDRMHRKLGANWPDRETRCRLFHRLLPEVQEVYHQGVRVSLFTARKLLKV